MSKLSRVVRFILAIWLLAFLLATPQAFQFGTVQVGDGGMSCTVKSQENDEWPILEHAFEVSSFLFFIVPMTVICVLYILIGLKLRQSKLLYGKKMNCDSQRCIKGQTRVIRMLIAVVVTFFLCWAPFHAQRIMAIYGKIMKKSSSADDMFLKLYTALTYVSGITYFLSTCINPLLYNIMSHKFRNASKLTLFVHCFSRSPSTKKSQLTSNYSALTLKFVGLDAGRMAAHRNQLILPSSHNSSEILEIRDQGAIDDRTFTCRTSTDASVPPFMMDHPISPYQSIVTFAPSYEPINFNSYSQHTTTTTISRDNSLKQHDVPCCLKVQFDGNMNHRDTNNKMNTISEKLRKCRQIFKTDSNSIATTANDEKKPKMVKKFSNGSIHNTISNSSLQEIDEEEFSSSRSSEMAQVMSEINNEIRHLTVQTS